MSKSKQFSELIPYYQQQFSGQNIGKQSTPAFLPNVPVRLYNNTANYIIAGQILKIGGPYPTLTWGTVGGEDQTNYNNQYYRETMIISGDDVDVDTNDNVIVATTDLEIGGTGLGVCTGLVIAIVNVESGSYDFANWVGGSNFLHLDTSGYKILWYSDTYEITGTVCESTGWQGEAGTYATCLLNLNAGTSSGGSTIKLVQAQDYGTNGTVSVKDVTLKADVTASPNFETLSAAYNVTYLKI